ncbi:MAG: 2'-5' RNA ligase family protein [Nocardioidaceae bacterium]
MAYSCLVVPVPELEPVVRPRLRQRSPEYLFSDPDETHAHITLLAPFAAEEELTDGLLAELRRFFADVTPFPFALTGVCEFPGGTTYLSPEPASPFRQLTLELSRRFPEYPPYGGAFGEVVPHLSVPVPPGQDPEQLRRELEPRLPIRAHAREATLFVSEPGAFSVVDRFGFGTSVA